jgi:DNA mismatch repair protein MutS
MTNDFDTPVIKQWRKIKSAHENEILFYRLGDFYELFYEDAILSARLLNIQLTKRKNKAENIPMAGVPYHSANNYISKLLKFGYSVVLCEQVGESKDSVGLMERRVERVLTPATVIEEEFLDEKKENVLASLFFDLRKNKVAISLIDITNGNFQCLETNFQEFQEEIKNINPIEVIVNSKFKDLEIIEFIKNIKFLTWDVELSECYHYLLKHFEVSNLYSFKIEDSNHIIKSSYNALIYVQNKINNELKYIKNIERIEKNNFLYIDNNSKKHLDIFNENNKNSLFSLLDSCLTNMGSRKLYKWLDKPLNKKELILERQNAITELKNNNELSTELIDIGDIERILSRVYLKSARPKDLLTLKVFLGKLPNIKNILNKYKSDKIVNINKNIHFLEELRNLIDIAINEDSPLLIKDGDVIKEGYDNELDDLKNIKNSITYKLIEIEEKEKKNNNIDKLKVSYNKIIGYYIEITNKNIDKVPKYFIRKQTLKNVERFYTEELKMIEDQVFSAQSKSLIKEKEIYNEILNIISQEYDNLKITVEAIAELDVLNNLSDKIDHLNLSKPLFNNDYINIKNARHIIIENNQDTFESNSLHMNKDKQMFIITGANMGGKSTFMRQNALIIILSQIGFYVPAEFCDIKIFDKLFTRIGSSDNISEGLSTFMVEMTETAHILNNSNENTFILLDEIGRGTSTYEGVSIAWSVAKKIVKDLNSFCLFATHYFELTELEKEYNEVKNVFLDSYIDDNGDLKFSHQVKYGHVNNSYGIEVAKLAGVPSDVILESRLKLKSLENCETNNNFNDITLDYINAIDINSINPREALNILYKIEELKNKK